MSKRAVFAGSCFIVLIAVLSVSANAEPLIAMVADMREDGITLYTPFDLIDVKLSDNTVWNTDGVVMIGDVITVGCSESGDENNLQADTVLCYRVSGTVTEIVQDGDVYMMLQPEDGTEEVRVNIDCISLNALAVGMPATVYYNGIRTRSVPAQITALYIRGFTSEGIITAVAEDMDIFELLTDNGETALIHLSPECIVLTGIMPGSPVRVSVLPQMRLSLPPQYEAQDILPIDQRKEENDMRSIATLQIQYAHRFYGFKGEAQYLHGHTGTLTIEVEDSINDGVNMVFPCNEIQKIAWSVLKNFDHALVLRQDDPLLPAILDVYEAQGIRRGHPQNNMQGVIFMTDLATAFPECRLVVTRETMTVEGMIKIVYDLLRDRLQIAKLTFSSGVNTASQEYAVNGTQERCPLCGVALDESGTCPKCGYRK